MDKGTTMKLIGYSLLLLVFSPAILLISLFAIQHLVEVLIAVGLSGLVAFGFWLIDNG